MTRRTLFGYALASAAVGFALLAPTAAPAQQKDAPLKLGMASTFFTDLPKAFVDLVTAPFPEMMLKTTGLKGALLADKNAHGVVSQLETGDIHFGVLHGHELAWMQKKHPKLKPLMVVVNKQHNVQAFVVVKKDGAIKEMNDLRGKTIDFPLMSKEHTRIFVAKYSSDNAQKSFFKDIVHSDSYFGALDDIAKGKGDAIAVDSIMLSFYKEIKGPYFANNLRVLKASSEFPPAVIVYKEGALPDATLKQFCAGLLKANQDPAGRDLMKDWSIDGFEMPPANFQKMLDATLLEFPAPASVKVGKQ